MGFPKAATSSLVFVSIASMLLLAACAPGIKMKELKTQEATQVIQGSNYTVTFESLRVSSLNGYSSDGTIKFALTDVRTGTSRQMVEYVRGLKDQATSGEFQTLGDEPRMTYSARCASMTCDRFEIVVLFVAVDGQNRQLNAMALGVVQDPTQTKFHFQDFGAEQVSFEQIIAAADASVAQ